MKIEKILEVINREFKGKSINGCSCKYLTEDDKKCAIGLFIPDGHEAQDFDGGVSSLLRKYSYLIPLMPSKDIDKLIKFQKTHDGLDESLTVEQQKKVLCDAAVELFGENE